MSTTQTATNTANATTETLTTPTTTSRNPIAIAERLLNHPDVGQLLLRGILAAIGIFHGAQKLFGIWGGPGIEGFAGFLESLSVPMPLFSAYAAAIAEFGGGILIAVGLWARLAAIPFAATMLVAIITVHPSGFDARTGGMEFPLLILIALLSLALTGPGKLTLPNLVRSVKRNAKAQNAPALA